MDIVNGSTARWWVVVVLSVALFALVIATWGFMKSTLVRTLPAYDTRVCETNK